MGIPVLFWAFRSKQTYAYNTSVSRFPHRREGCEHEREGAQTERFLGWRCRAGDDKIAQRHHVGNGRVQAEARVRGEQDW